MFAKGGEKKKSFTLAQSCVSPPAVQDCWNHVRRVLCFNQVIDLDCNRTVGQEHSVACFAMWLSEPQAAFTLWTQGAHATKIRFLHDSSNLAWDPILLSQILATTLCQFWGQHNYSTFNGLSALIWRLYVYQLPAYFHSALCASC